LYSTQVAALATLAILRVIAASSSSSSKENENVSIKCITFSQPPVGNAALKEYVFPVLFFSISKLVSCWFFFKPAKLEY